MANEHEIILEIEGEEFLLPGDIEIVSSMLNVANTFTVDTIFFKDTDLPAYAGKECVMKIDGEAIVSGYIDIAEVEYDTQDNSLQVSISGRDKTADLIDCQFDFEPNEWKEITVQDVLANLCAPFAIELYVDPEVQSNLLTQLETYKANEGEYVVDMVTELCLNHGVLPMSVGDGKLTLTKATTINRALEKLSTGSNIIWGKRISNNINRFSSYKVKGQSIGNDNKSLEDITEPIGEQTDSIITRDRPYVTFADGPVDSGKCQIRAQWEGCIRAGLSRAVIYKYDSFYQAYNGPLWRKNEIVEIVDDIFDINEEKLISEVRYIKSGDSRAVFLTCVDKKTFSVGDPSDIYGPGD